MGLRLFVEVKRLFSITPEAKFISKSSWIETEVTRVTGRGLGMTGCVRSVLPACCERACTGASGQAPEGQQTQRVDQTRWRIQSRSTGRVRSWLGAYWNRPDTGTVASSQYKRRVQSASLQRELQATGH
jgi:hypothetical protein